MTGRTLSGREKRAKFARVMEQHAAWEKRSLADLRVLGHDFKTMESAKKHQKALRTLDQMTASDLLRMVEQQQQINRIKRSLT